MQHSPSFTERLRASPRPLLWLEASAYAARLLAQGEIPWLDSAQYVAWRRKTQSLLEADVIAVPLGALVAAWIQGHEELVTAMTAKRRTPHPLRALLSDESLRTHAADLIKDLRSTFPDRVLALVVPAPRIWVSEAYALAHGGESPEVDDDDAESAGVYIADFLRTFADGGVDALLLQTASTAPPLRLDDPSYEPVANLSSHYRWDLGVQSAAGPSGENAAVKFVVGPTPVTALATGIAVAAEFWQEAEALLPPPAGGFWFAEIPATADPERVLERLRRLRQSLPAAT